MINRAKALNIVLFSVVFGLTACKAGKPTVSPEEQLAQLKIRFGTNQESCKKTLKTIGLALILYSYDQRNFPHMQDSKKDNEQEDVVKVFESLVYKNNLGTDDTFVCPSSHDQLVKANEKVDKKHFKIGSEDGYSDTLAPIKRDQSGNGLYQNKFLSYTYRKRFLTMDPMDHKHILAADKFPHHLDSKGRWGYHVFYVDGQIKFVPLSDTAEIKRLQETLLLAKPDTSEYKEFEETFMKVHKAKIIELAGSVEAFFKEIESKK